MTDLEHDLELSLEWWTPNPYFEDDAEDLKQLENLVRRYQAFNMND